MELIADKNYDHNDGTSYENKPIQHYQHSDRKRTKNLKYENRYHYYK